MSPPGCFTFFCFLFPLPYSSEGTIQTYTVCYFFEKCNRFAVKPRLEMLLVIHLSEKFKKAWMEQKPAWFCSEGVFLCVKTHFSGGVLFSLEK